MQNDTAYYAYYHKYQPNRSFGTALPLFPEYFQIIVRKDAKILHIESLVGKRIALGAVGSGTYRNAKDILKAAEINFDPQPTASLEEALEKLRRGDLDAVCYTAAAPPLSLRSLESDLTLLSLTGSLVDKLVRQHPYFHKGHLPRKGMESVSTISLMAYLVLSNNAPSGAMEKLLALAFDSWDQLADKENYQQIPLASLPQAIQRKPVPLHENAQKLLVEKGYLFDPWRIGYYLLALIVIAILVQYFSHILTTRCDRLGNLQPIKSMWRYQLTLFLQGFAVLVATLTVMALAYFIIMLVIQYYEGRYATENNLYNQFVTMTIPDLMLWLWGWIGGYNSRAFPQSTIGKILAVFPPLVGIFFVVWFVFSIWRDIISRRVAKQKGFFVHPLKNHIIICGWNEKARGIIFGLTSPYVPQRKKIVVIAEMDDEKPLEKYNFPKNMVYYYRGDSSDTKALEASHITQANVALILAGEKKKHARNIGSVLTTLAIKNLNPNVFTIAELRHIENQQNFETCDIDALVFAETIIYRLAAQACFNPLAVSWFFDMITHDEHVELYAMPWKTVIKNDLLRAAVEVFQQKKTLSSLYNTLKLLVHMAVFSIGRRRWLDSINPTKLCEILARRGISLIAIYHAGKNDHNTALVQHTFSAGLYTNFISAVKKSPLQDNDVLIFAALEKEDIFPALNSRSSENTSGIRQDLTDLTMLSRKNCQVLLIGGIDQCKGIIAEIQHLDHLNYQVITQNTVAKEIVSDTLDKHIKDEVKVSTVIILADTQGSDKICLDHDRGELDAKTLLIARYINSRFSDHNKPVIIAEMLGRNTRELFISAGVDVVLPCSLAVERLIIKMAYGLRGCQQLSDGGAGTQ